MAARVGLELINMNPQLQAGNFYFIVITVFPYLKLIVCLKIIKITGCLYVLA